MIIAIVSLLVGIALPALEKSRREPSTDTHSVQPMPQSVGAEVLVPDWYQARYTVRAKFGSPNELFSWMLGLSAITLIASAIHGAATTKGPADNAGCGIAIGVPLALAVLCYALTAIVNVVVGIMRPTGSIPFDFIGFCLLVVANLTLVFVWTSRLIGRERDEFDLTTPKHLLLSIVKATVVAALTAIANSLGGWIGGLVAGILMSAIAACVNPRTVTTQKTEALADK